MLPASLRIATTPGEGIGGDFKWARERLRVLSANSPAQAVREYERMGKHDALDDAQRYGLALAHYLDGNPARAIDEPKTLLHDHYCQPALALPPPSAERRTGRTETVKAPAR